MKFLKNLFRRPSEIRDGEEENEDKDIDPIGDDSEHDDGPSGGGNKKKFFVFAGVGVLVLGMSGGGAFWYSMVEPPKLEDARIKNSLTAEKSSESKAVEVGVEVALPPRKSTLNSSSGGGSGSLNALTSEGSGTLNSSSGGGSGSLNTLTEGGKINDAIESNSAQNELSEKGTEVDRGKLDIFSKRRITPIGQQIVSPKTLGSSSLNATAANAVGAAVIIPSVTAASFKRTKNQLNPIALARAPDKKLIERVAGLGGPLPMISKDGKRKPWEVYARPLTGQEEDLRIGILVTDVGLSRAATMAAITKLPGEISLVFNPYGQKLDSWFKRARRGGHEVFVGLPMESENFPAEDPGPLALMSSVQVADNIKRLHSVLSSFAGYVGVVSAMGSKFSTAEGQLKPLLEEVNKRGLMFVEGGAIMRSAAPQIAEEINLPRAKSNMILDEYPYPNKIKQALRRLEKMARKNKAAIGTIRAYPSSIFMISEWAKKLNSKKISLVPVSAIANIQPID